MRYPDGSGCGSPILTFHHFGPPWAGNFVHNIEGMVALCPQHHRQADGGLWTKSQFKEMKENPFVDDIIKMQWPWMPENIVIKFGRSLVVGGGSPIRLYGKPIFQFKPLYVPEFGVKQISFESYIFNEQGVPWLRIKDNIFEIDLLNTTDLLFTPQTKSFQARSNDETYIELSYRKYEKSIFVENAKIFMRDGKAFQTLDDSLENSGSVDSEGKINLVEINGHFRTPDVELSLLRGEMNLKTFIPGIEEDFDFHSWIVSEKSCMVMDHRGKGEFLRLG
ncbi:MAG: hypothetical protein HN368_23960 [Spirochaetales bacterium]|nr:hypothetical protein [Spirochaetales bacterium]